MESLSNETNTDFYWGLKPSPVLEKFIDLVPKGLALDVGAGEGRNSFFLAKNGFKVEAIDKTKEGLEKCEKIAQENNLPITTAVCNITNFDFKKDKYSLTIAKHVLDFLKNSEAKTIVEKIKKSLVSDGFAYISVFSINDPVYQKIRNLNLDEIEKDTFYLPKYQGYRCFFTIDEIESMFKDFKIVYLKEIEIKDPGHGEDKPHIHRAIEIFAQKIKVVD